MALACGSLFLVALPGVAACRSMQEPATPAQASSSPADGRVDVNGLPRAELHNALLIHDGLKYMHRSVLCRIESLRPFQDERDLKQRVNALAKGPNERLGPKHTPFLYVSAPACVFRQPGDTGPSGRILGGAGVALAAATKAPPAKKRSKVAAEAPGAPQSCGQSLHVPSLPMQTSLVPVRAVSVLSQRGAISAESRAHARSRHSC